jgi:hypothetical protein
VSERRKTSKKKSKKNGKSKTKESEEEQRSTPSPSSGVEPETPPNDNQDFADGIFDSIQRDSIAPCCTVWHCQKNL